MIQELRLGNFVNMLFETGKIETRNFTPLKVTRIEEHSILTNTPKESLLRLFEGEFTGIPITEEWLERMGFSRIDGNDAGNVYGFVGEDMLVNDDLKFIYMFKGHGLPKMEEKFLRRNKEFKYVHQIQNLYFALTGEELTIKQLV